MVGDQLLNTSGTGSMSMPSSVRCADHAPSVTWPVTVAYSIIYHPRASIPFATSFNDASCTLAEAHLPSVFRVHPAWTAHRIKLSRTEVRSDIAPQWKPLRGDCIGARARCCRLPGALMLVHRVRPCVEGHTLHSFNAIQRR